MRRIVILFYTLFTGSLLFAQFTTPNPPGGPIYYNLGNVGINTTNPLEKFQIGDRLTFQDGGWKGILYNMAWNSTLNSNARIVNGPVAGMYFTSDGNIIFQNGATGAAGSSTSNALWSMVINNNGSVGIGTTSTFNYMLAVNGSAIFTQAVVKLYTNWPDYVFKKEYPLPSLKSVADYIRAYNRLPGMPSADSVQHNGLDLGKTQAKLLEKIEELTLYTIDLQKQIEKLETANKELTISIQQSEVTDKKLESLQQQINELKGLLKRQSNIPPAD